VLDLLIKAKCSTFLSKERHRLMYEEEFPLTSKSDQHCG
jgi:hypothetical protein